MDEQVRSEKLPTVTQPAGRNILLVDDDPNMHLICRKVLGKAGYNIFGAPDGARGLASLLDERVDLILLDYMMPQMDGFQFLEHVRSDPKYAAYKDIPVIMLTVISDDNPKRKALQELGLSLFLNKPFGHKELVNIIENVFMTHPIQVRRREQTFRHLQRARDLAVENRKLRSALDQENALNAIIGTNMRMKEIIDRIRKVATTDASVLITGESGTGKELVARAIHDCSRRASSGFVPVDCVALPGTLLESELFGYEKGAFTGATQSKKGLLETAHGGTFFLDEIGELNPELQAKLLRVLQERQFRHVGGKELISVDIRVIAATNRDPLKAVDEGILRQDLYYRLNVIPIQLPPLRERADDIPLLVNRFLNKFNARDKRQITGVTDAAMEVLQRHSWPGNIRELQNLVERMVSLANGSTIDLRDLPESLLADPQASGNVAHVPPGTPLREARAQWLEQFERTYLVDLIDHCGGNISQVARLAGINRMTVYRMLKKYNIKVRFQVGAENTEGDLVA